MPSHVIFDFDGCLSNSFGVACEEHNRIVSAAFPTVPLVHTHEDYAFAYCGPLKTSLRRFGLTDAQAADFFDRHSAAMQSRSADIAPFDEAIAAIGAHLPGRSSIVSSCYRDAIVAILSKSPHFRPALFREILGREWRQPKSRKIRHVLGLIGLQSDEVVYVGDLVSDILYCRAVPVRVATVGYGYHPGPYLCAFSPDYHVEALQDLGAFLEQVAG